MTKNKSNLVTTNQIGINEGLNLLGARYTLDNFRKPIPDFSIKVFDEILDWIKTNNNKSLVLDVGCGVGESSYNLAIKYKNDLVIGIDKSLIRISKNNKFKQSLPTNLKLVRGDIIDLWRLFYKHRAEIRIKKQYILYPNPWPLKHHYKKRWHGHPVFPFIIALDTPIELRTNWRLYLEEFSFCLHRGEKFLANIEVYRPEIIITPFERKFCDSGHELYRFMYNPH